MATQRIVIVGGVAGGATAAARLRRLSEDAEIVVLERGPYISFANCGLPYYVGGDIAQRDALLLQTPEGLRARYNIDVRVRHEVLEIDRAERALVVRDLAADTTYRQPYDQLVLSPGAAPLRPPLPGIDHPRIMTVRTVPDIDKVKAAVDAGARSALVVGGGFIGLEMVENLVERGLTVHLVEMLDQVMPPLDREMAEPIHEQLRAAGVDLRLGGRPSRSRKWTGRFGPNSRTGV
jgi:NADPH-dependent 2,4-dienoyl-CoA reductase/sulfur reductase-like enzyme